MTQYSKILLLFVVCFLSPKVYAGDLRFGFDFALMQDYRLENLESDFSSQSFGVDISYLSKNDNAFSIESGTPWYWGIGLNYNKMNVDRTTQGPLDFVSDDNFNLDKINAKIFPGLNFSEFYIEVPISFSFLKEKGELNGGDEKYGYGFGLNVHYRFYSKWAFGIGYEQFSYQNGKNSSTGQSGSLENPVKITQLMATISYSFSIGGGDYQGGSFESY